MTSTNGVVIDDTTPWIDAMITFASFAQGATIFGFHFLKAQEDLNRNDVQTTNAKNSR